MKNQCNSMTNFVCLVSTFLAIISSGTNAFSQNDKGSQLYKTWIKIRNNQSNELGYLYQVKDSSLIITNGFKMTTISNVEGQLNELFYADINALKVQKKGSVGRGAGKGALIGLGVGVVGGLIAYGMQGSGSISFSSGEYILAMSIISVPLGTLIGTAAGGSKRKIPIQQNPKYFKQNRSLLREYAIQK